MRLVLLSALVWSLCGCDRGPTGREPASVELRDVVEAMDAMWAKYGDRVEYDACLDARVVQGAYRPSKLAVYSQGGNERSLSYTDCSPSQGWVHSHDTGVCVRPAHDRISFWAGGYPYMVIHCGRGRFLWWTRNGESGTIRR